MTRLATVVHDALEHGSLFGVRPYGKSLTLCGRRRVTIRVQSDIFRALHTPDTGPPFYPDIWDDVLAQVRAEARERRQAVRP